MRDMATDELLCTGRNWICLCFFIRYNTLQLNCPKIIYFVFSLKKELLLAEETGIIEQNIEKKGMYPIRRIICEETALWQIRK